MQLLAKFKNILYILYMAPLISTTAGSTTRMASVTRLNGEFWLGLDNIHRLTNTKYRLRVDLEDTTGKTAYAEYDMFAVTSERTKYQLSLGTYSGNHPILLVYLLPF